MLKPYTQQDAKPKRGVKRNHTPQCSLFDFRPEKPTKQATKLATLPLVDILATWDGSMKSMEMDEIQALTTRCFEFRSAICAQASQHYGRLKKNTAVSNPSDIGAYLVLREIDDKSQKEIPGHGIHALDFCITALREG